MTVGATVLFFPSSSSSGSWGSTVRLATIAEQCRSRGDRVVFHACTPSDDHLRERGMEVVAFTGIPPAGLASGPVETFHDICEVLGYGERDSWERLLRAESDLITAVRPDVVVADMRPTAQLSASRHGVPLVACAWAGAEPGRQATGDHALDDMARSIAADWCELRPRSVADLMYRHADRQLALSFPAFEPELADCPDLVYTGYLRDERSSGQSLPPVPDRLVVVYASSSPWGTPSIVDAFDEAARRAGVAVWCVLRSDTPMRQVSEHCTLFRYLPMDEVLPSASALVFHGGLSTALAALHHGVPALAIPGRHYERRRNAERLRDLGIGLVGELADLLPSRLSGLLEQLAEDTGMRRAAASAQAEAARYQGAAAAADAVHELLDTRKAAV